MNQIGAVVIGRNEGDRLRLCLTSILGQVDSIVYVDSGSTDGSVELAKSLNIEVVELDLTIPFTAARARNAGFQHLTTVNPQLKYVQFVDGDCEILPGWIEIAAHTLENDSQIVAVCGWRQECYPKHSLYNTICNIEWRMGSVGIISSFGGDVMIRSEAFKKAQGYNNSVIAAEDDELSVRLRQNNGQLVRIARNSTKHDANMYHIWQWWKRAKRCGYGYAQVFSLHGKPPESKFAKEMLRALLWGLIFPLSIFLLLYPTHGLVSIILLRYPLTALRVSYSTRQQGFLWSDSFAWGVSCSVSVFPEIVGICKFYFDRLQNQQHQIIEYKSPTSLR